MDPEPTVEAWLSRDQVIAEALALADEEGLRAVSMQRLAGRLGVATMTLYGRITGKDDMLDAMAAVAIEAIDLPAPDLTWQDTFRHLARSLREATQRHPALVALIMTRQPTTISALRPLETLLAALARAGFSDRDMVNAAHLMMGGLTGLLLAEQRGVFGPRDGFQRVNVIELTTQLPTIVRLAPLLSETSQTDFDDAVEIVITGLVDRLPNG